MKQFDIINFKNNTNDLANLFNVYLDKDGNYYFNISKTLCIKQVDINNLQPSIYNLYTVQYNDTWTNISFNFYKTIDLWWIICKFNNISDPTVSPIEGEKLIIPTLSIVSSIVKLLKNR